MPPGRQPLLVVALVVSLLLPASITPPRGDAQTPGESGAFAALAQAATPGPGSGCAGPARRSRPASRSPGGTTAPASSATARVHRSPVRFPRR